MGAGQLREAGLRAGAAAARVGALVHAPGLGFGHGGLVALGAFPRAAFAREDGEGEEGEGAAGG